MTRQIVLDTETTGIDPKLGHKLIEIGCVELINRRLTGRHYHVYLNPQREVDIGAYKVHGISTAFLQDKPLFSHIVKEFLHFIEGGELIIHNAPFDLGFLNTELALLEWEKNIQDYASITDTLVLAREMHPGQKNNLDALCKRYSIDNSNRTLHGALLDAEILALVYLAMTGGQRSMFTEDLETLEKIAGESDPIVHLNLANPVLIQASESEKNQHLEFIDFLKKKSGVTHWDELLEES